MTNEASSGNACDFLQLHSKAQPGRTAIQDVGEMTWADVQSLRQGGLGHSLPLQHRPDSLLDGLRFSGHGQNIRTTRTFESSEYSGHSNIAYAAISGVNRTVTEKRLADFLRTALEPRGAKAALARACGVSPSKVTEWADGKYPPHMSELDAIAAFFGVEVGALFASDQPRQTSTKLSPSETRGGENVETVAGLLKAVKEARKHGVDAGVEALERIAEAIGNEIKKLAGDEDRASRSRTAPLREAARTRRR